MPTKLYSTDVGVGKLNLNFITRPAKSLENEECAVRSVAIENEECENKECGK